MTQSDENMNSILLLLNSSKREIYHNNNHSNNLLAKKISITKKKKNKNINKLIQNYSSSFMKRKNKKIKQNLIAYNIVFNYKRNKSSKNSASSHKIKNKTPKIKKRINKSNKNKTNNNLKKQFTKKIPSKKILTLSHDKKITDSFRNNNIGISKDKTKIKLKNNFMKNNLFLNTGHSFNYINLNNYRNTKNSENSNKYSSFYKKINNKQNIAINRINNINNKKYQIKLNSIKKNKNIGNNSFDKNSESINKIRLKKSGIIQRKEINLSNLKNIKNGLKKFLEKPNRKIMNKGIYKKIKKIYMKTNQGNYTSRRNSSCSRENIFLNNNYNNFINFNYINKNYNINIPNRQVNIKPNKNSYQKIIYKKINNGFITQRKDNNELFNFLQLKLKANNQINTLQSKEEVSISDLKKMNSYINIIPNNSSFNLISPEIKIKNNPDKNTIVNKKNSNKDKEENNIKKSQNQRNKNKISNKENIIKSRSSINNINNISISTTKDNSYYIKEREKLCSYIKKYYKEKGHYPKSNISFYKYGRLLGKGAFGKVNLALHIASGKLVAIKSFNKKKLLTEHSKQKIKTEIEVLKKLKNNIYCTKIFDTFQTETHILIVMEFICADLLDFIRKRDKLNEKTSKIIFKQVVLGLKYMHKNNIVHRDIKLDNLLLDLSNTIKICDFGVSKILKSSDELMFEHCGSPTYIAPEVLGKNGYKGFSCDIWSLGVTLYYILGGDQPFGGKDMEELKKKFFLKNYYKIKFVSDEANDLLDKMLTKNPEERITLDEIIKHKWLEDVDISNKNKIKIFSKNEKYLLGKYNVCYLKNHTEDFIEDFNKDNLITSEDDNKKGNTKSIILTPYNTSVSFFNDSYEPNNNLNNEIKIENNICKYKAEVQISNIKYELSNNNEFDNGVIKTTLSNSITSFSDFSSISQKMKNGINKNNNINLSFDDKNKNNIRKNFCEEIIKEIEDKVGYNRNYVIQCLKNDEINYATATYYLMLEDKKEKNDFI